MKKNVFGVVVAPIGHIDSSCIKPLFERCGEIEKIDFKKDNHKKCLLSNIFKTVNAANLAVKEYDGEDFIGKRVSVIRSDEPILQCSSTEQEVQPKNHNNNQLKSPPLIKAITKNSNIDIQKPTQIDSNQLPPEQAPIVEEVDIPNNITAEIKPTDSNKKEQISDSTEEYSNSSYSSTNSSDERKSSRKKSRKKHHKPHHRHHHHHHHHSRRRH